MEGQVHRHHHRSPQVLKEHHLSVNFKSIGHKWYQVVERAFDNDVMHRNSPDSMYTWQRDSKVEKTEVCCSKEPGSNRRRKGNSKVGQKFSNQTLSLAEGLLVLEVPILQDPIHATYEGRTGLRKTFGPFILLPDNYVGAWRPTKA